MSTPTRRAFLNAAGSGIAAAAGILATASKAKASPNDRVQHAVIGLGGQGRAHARTFAALKNCDLVAICDVDPARRDQAAGEIPAPARPKKYEHFQKILDDPAIDSVSIATPDHWHAPIALAALLAGKHVYVEKPCCHNVHEGRRLAAAAARSGKCVQHGTQSRSGQGIQEAIRFLREGGLGKVRMAKAINHQLREPIGRSPVTQAPPGVNYDLWTGPAPAHPFTQNRWHYNWHWFWDYGSGDMGNDGIHQIDVARWGLGVEYPKQTNATGGQLFYDDDHETPDTQTVVFDYGICHLVYEMRLWTNYKLEGHDNGTIFYGDNGILEIGRRGCEVTLIGEETKRIGGGGDFDENVKNFVDCIRADDPKSLNSPIDEGVVSSILCHLGNIGTRVARNLRYDPATGTTTVYRSDPTDDPATGKITGDEEANRLLTRHYRSGYELPHAT